VTPVEQAITRHEAAVTRMWATCPADHVIVVDAVGGVMGRARRVDVLSALGSNAPSTLADPAPTGWTLVLARSADGSIDVELFIPAKPVLVAIETARRGIHLGTA